MSDGHVMPASDMPSPRAFGGEQPREGQDPTDLLRAHHYSLLAVLLAGAPSADTLELVAGLTGDSSPLGLARVALAQAAETADPAALQREYFRLFIGVGRGELVAFGSFYLTGFLQEKPLARLRQDLAQLGVERSPDLAEPEDHIGVLCEVMAGLIDGRFDTPGGADQRFFLRHLKPWAARFFADLEAAEGSNFYKHVGTVGRSLMGIETEALDLAA